MTVNTSPATDRSHRLVVTGTGTGVGKTFVSAELLSLFAATSRRCLGLKPVETGFVDPNVSDAERLARAAGHALTAPRFTSHRAESAHRAARFSNTQIEVGELAEWVSQQQRAARAETVLVETAGGLFSPLAEASFNIDLVRALEPCTFVLVAADRLGALHDVLSAVTASKAVHRAPDVVCMNLQDDAALSLENAPELRRFVATIPVIQAPLLRFSTPDALRKLFSAPCT